MEKVKKQQYQMILQILKRGEESGKYCITAFILYNLRIVDMSQNTFY